MANAVRAACGVVVASLVVTTIGEAQGVRLQFGVGGGATIPAGEYHADASGDGFNPGWQGIALVALRFPGSPLGIRLAGTYGQNSANDQFKADLSAAVGAPTDAKTKLLGGTVDVTYEFPSAAAIKPYVLGGIGMYNVKLAVTSGSAAANPSETKFAWNAGAGFTFARGGAGLFLEARYLGVTKAFNAGKTTCFPVTAGVRLGAR